MSSFVWEAPKETPSRGLLGRQSEGTIVTAITVDMGTNTQGYGNTGEDNKLSQQALKSFTEEATSKPSLRGRREMFSRR